MKIKEKIEDHVAILSLRGKMMGGPETASFHDHIKSLIDDGIKNVIVDLGEVRWMNSSGLGVLMAAMTTLKNANGRMVIARATEKVESLLVITQLIKVFETYETVDRALASFSE